MAVLSPRHDGLQVRASQHKDKLRFLLSPMNDTVPVTRQGTEANTSEQFSKTGNLGSELQQRPDPKNEGAGLVNIQRIAAYVHVKPMI